MDHPTPKLSVGAALLAILWWCAAAGSVTIVRANPSGPSIAAGQATISGGAGGLTITQGSARAIINWSDFSIGASEWTKFVQPDVASAVLNRVVSGQPSSLLGSLEANGRVFLINPNGIVIGRDARIDVGGFLASTLDVRDTDFLGGGDLVFKGDSTATVQNLGRIDATTGDVFLIARRVENSGSIHAATGTVGAAAGSEVLLTSDNHIFVLASSSDGSIENAGEIDAARADLRAAGGNPGALAINNTGTVRATGVAERNGEVWLVADRGDVISSGTLAARSGDGADGGDVRVLGERVALTGNGQVDVSGARRGGTVLLGGGFQGKDPAVPNAQAITMTAGASVRADGDEHGGRVIVWSDDATRFAGNISARGEGFVEVSGKGSLGFFGNVDTGGGTLLLDPTDITVVSGTSFDGGTGLDDGTWAFGEAGSVVGTDNLRTALGSGSVVLQASNDITWDTGATLDYNGIGTGKSLTLQANRDILFTGSILDSIAGGDALGIVFNSDRDALSGGGIHLNSGSQIESNGGDIVFGGGANPAGVTAFGTVGTGYRGVFLSDATISSGAGNITLLGTGGVTGAGVGIGVDLVNSTVTSTSGNILINGYGASGATPTNLGISVFSGTQVRTTSGGNITMTGIASASATGTYNAGISIAQSPMIEAQGGGSVSLTGIGSTGGSGSENHGVYIQNNSSVLVSGSGSLTLTGTAGAGSSGIATLTGSNWIGNATPASFTGALTLAANSLSLAAVTVGGSGALTIQPTTTATTIGLGDGAGGTLNLTGAELATLADGFSSLTFGRDDGSGAIDVRAVALKDPVTIRSPSGAADITVNGALSTGGGSSAGSIELRAGNSVLLAAGGSIVTQGQPVTLNSDRDASGAGIISLTTGTSITTNGGDITLRGGDATLGAVPDPTGDPAGFFSALQATGSRGDGSSARGISITGATLDAGGGDIEARGIAADSLQGVWIASGATVTTTGSGTISLYGAGGPTGNDSDGVGINGTNTAVTAGNGNITLFGLGRGGDESQGVAVVGTTGSAPKVETSNGDVVIRGQSQATGGLDQGVLISTTGVVRTTGSGNLDIAGRGSGNDGNGHGVLLIDDAVAQTTGGGNITITGYATTSAITSGNNEGSKIQDGSLVEIQTGSNRTLAITGKGGTGTSYNIGVNNRGGTVRMGADVTGQMIVTGYGGAGTGTGNWGVLAEGSPSYPSGIYESLGASSITLQGTGGTGSDNTGIKHTGGTNRIGSSSMTGAINLIADSIDLLGFSDTITVRSSGALTIEPLNTATTIGLGNSSAGTLNLDSTEIGRLADGFSSITIGRADGTGAINVRTSTFTDPLVLTNTGAGSGGISITGALNTGTNILTLASAGNVTQTSAITAGSLLLSGAGSFTLNNAANVVGTLAAATSGPVTYANNFDFAVGAVAGVNGITSDGEVALRTTAGNITLNQPISVTGSANATVAASGNFINNAGAGAISTDSGRWLVWSNDPASDTRGGLSSDFKQYNATYGVTAPAQSTGNGFLYDLAPLISVSLTGSATKSYDGTTTADLASTQVVPSGAIDGDTVSLGAPTSGTYADQNVGAGKTVSASGLTIASATNGSITIYGYQLVSTTASSAIGEITPATLTYAADPASRLYGGTNPVFSGSVSGFVNGETVATATTGMLAFSTPATPASDVGTYAINGSGLTANNGNYVFVQAGSNATALTIDPAPLTVTANDAARTYGAANPAFSASYQGFVLGQNASVLGGSLSFTTPATASSSVGTYAITPGGLTSSNYAITFTDGVLTIDPALLTIAAADASRLYGANNPAFTATYSGFVNNDDASIVSGLAFSTPATAASNVGAYAITPSGASAPNYSIAYQPGTLTIDPAALTITANDVSRLYGADNPVFTASFSGLVNGDDASVVSGLTLSTSATPSSDVGRYAINSSSGTAQNYTLSYVPGTLTIDPTLLTVTANDAARTYGAANPAFSASYQGFVLGQNASVLGGSLSFTTPATASSSVGTYAITPGGLTSSNYAITFTDGVLTIDPALLTIAAADASRLYGANNPAFTATYSGFVNNDDASIVSGLAFSTPATAASNVGAYAITPSGASASNYSIAYQPGTLTINPAPLTIAADNAARTYGASNPTFTASYSGFVLDQNAANLSGTLSLTTGATTVSPVGNYAITPSGLTSANYAITFVGGVLTIDPALLTIRADSVARSYGSQNPAFTATYSGFIDNENASIVTGLTLSTPATAASDTGTYAITPAGASAPNYTIAYEAGTLTINPVPLTITANDAMRGFMEDNPPFSATYSGFVNNDTSSVVSGLNFETSAATESPPGVYTITPVSAIARNYTIQYVPGNLTVDAPSVVLDGAPAFVPIIDGRAALTTGFAVVNMGGRLTLLPVSMYENGLVVATRASEPVDEQLSAALSDAAAPPPSVAPSGVSTLPNVVPAANATVVATGAAAAESSPSIASDASLVRESAVPAGGFNIVYRENVADAAEFSRGNASVASSYREFEEAPPPRTVLLRAGPAESSQEEPRPPSSSR